MRLTDKNTGAAVAVLLIMAGPASADVMNCKFTTECFEAEACQETDYDVAIAGELSDARFESASASMIAFVEKSEAATTITARDDTGMHLLITTPDGSARYTNLMPDVPMVISYLGSCKMADAN